MKIDIMQRGMGAMGGFRDANESMDSDSSILEAAIDQSLVSCIEQCTALSETDVIFVAQMADDENEISARTQSTATDGGDSSRSYTASPTPASRAPGHGLIIDGTKRAHTAVKELPALPSVRFQMPGVDEAPASNLEPSFAGEEDVDMEPTTSSRSEKSTITPASPISARSVRKSPEVSSNGKSVPNGTAATVEKDIPATTEGEEQSQRASATSSPDPAVPSSAEIPTEDNGDSASEEDSTEGDSEKEESGSEEDSEDDSESEDDELEESQEDSSFEVDAEVASESSDEEEPAPRKPSRRRSSVAPATPAKARKSVVKTASVIVEAEKEEVDAPKQKSTRQSKREIKEPINDKAVEKERAPPSARTPLAETRMQEVVVPVKDMAELELDELSDSPVKQAKPEPIKKKKR
jgi:hypothetical protein